MPHQAAVASEVLFADIRCCLHDAASSVLSLFRRCHYPLSRAEHVSMIARRCYRRVTNGINAGHYGGIQA